jgi:hypothetical protein
MGAGASKPSQEEVQRRYKKCAALASAHAHCVRAARRDGGAAAVASACGALETSLLGCLAAQVAPQEAEAHTKCVNKAMSMRGKGPGACAAEVEAMARVVKKAGLWPPPPP